MITQNGVASSGMYTVKNSQIEIMIHTSKKVKCFSLVRRPAHQKKDFFTLRAKLSSAVYWNRFCLLVCVFVGYVCLWVYYHDN